MKRMSFFLLIIVVLLVASQVLLPAFVSQIMVQGMVNQTGSENASVQVQKQPAVLMLGGSFDKITIAATNARVDKLVFSQLQAVLTNVQLDMGTLLSRHLVALQSVGDIDMVATVTEQELAKYLNQSVKGIKNATVTITSDKVQASSSFSLGGFATVGITLEGRIVVDSQKLKFVTDRFLLNNSLVGNIGGATLTEIPLAELNKLPFHVTVREVVMENGKVVIYADNRGR